jgi:7-cyano-7-deazaguanine synthase in queuosine biosynthesis
MTSRAFLSHSPGTSAIVIHRTPSRASGDRVLPTTICEVHDAEREQDGIPNTYVPFRNANMLSIAVSWAEVHGRRRAFRRSGGRRLLGLSGLSGELLSTLSSV